MAYTRSGSSGNTKRPLRSRPWVVPLMVLTVVFLAVSVPPYVGLDPSQSRVPLPSDIGWYYPVLVTHIAFGSIALLTASLQVWPWLRQQYPTVHRWSGRIYVFGGALPAGVVVLGITPFSVSGGANQHTANTMLALLWVGTTVAGYRAVRQRRYSTHREWMIRSFALAFSIVVNRLWGVLCLIVFAPNAEPATSAGASPELTAAVGVSTWMSWIVNLLIAEWWLHRTRRRPQHTTPPAPRVADTTTPSPQPTSAAATHVPA